MQWLHFPDDPFELLAKSIGPPWEAELEAEHQLRPAHLETVDVTAGSGWERHERLLCPRCPGDDGAYPCFAVHRLTHGPGAASLLNEKLRAIADTLDGATAEAASTVGGWHSSRDLCTWPAACSAELPALLASAVDLAAGRAATNVAVDEAWLNSLDRGGWNTLHTHPGSVLSGVYYVADGGCCEHGADGLAGRLALIPTAPTRLSSEQLEAHVVSRLECPPGCTPPSQEAFDYLLVEPTPGTCVVWPSFVPHFVLPAAVAPAAANDDAQRPRRRVSVAFNAGPRKDPGR